MRLVRRCFACGEPPDEISHRLRPEKSQTVDPAQGFDSPHLHDNLTAVRIAVIGTGKMGRGFATALSPKHHVVFGSRDPARAQKVAKAAGAADAMSPAEAVFKAKVMVLAVPWRGIRETLAQIKDFEGVAIDMCVPYGKDQEALGRKSSGEFVQKHLPKARVVKGWSHVFAKYLTAPAVDGIASSVLLAGDNTAAKRTVSRLARDMGFHPVDVGRLRESYHLDRLVGMMLFVKLGRLRVLDAPR